MTAERPTFPGFSGNSVLTSHVTLSNGEPGPFSNLAKLSLGNKIFVRAFGELHIYEVRSMKNVGADDLSILKHEEKPWLTLMTCDKYDETKAAYLERLVVRAVLVHTQADNSENLRR